MKCTRNASAGRPVLIIDVMKLDARKHILNLKFLRAQLAPDPHLRGR
jgi:hypothetical protein